MKRIICIGFSFVFLVVSWGVYPLQDPTLFEKSGILSFYLLLIGLMYPFKEGK